MKNIKVVIIGGVAGGASTAARLRRLNENAEIIILERGPYVSFANCGLPYYIGDVIQERSALELMTPELFYQRFNFDVKTLNEVRSINIESKKLSVKNLKTKEDYTLDYDILVLSPGANPFIPPISGLPTVPFFTVRDIPDIEKIKLFIEGQQISKAVIIGGGFIGIEMAENLHHKGLKIEIIEMTPQILPQLDFEMAQIAHQEMGLQGIKLHLKEVIENITKKDSKILIHLKSGTQVEAELIILAAGVRPETELAQQAGLKLNPTGHIIVNNQMKTSNSDIYAVGDAVIVKNFITQEMMAIPLAGIANRQGRVAADNISGINSQFEGVLGTSVLKLFGLTISTSGMNERALIKSGIKYEKIYAHPNNHAGYYPLATSISMKLLFDPANGKIYGVQAVGGEGTEKRIDIISTTMKFKGTVFDLEKLELAYAPPYGSAKDPVNMLGFIAANILTNKVKIWHWNQIEEIKSKKSVILDVRTKEEYDVEHIEGAINISDLELRRHLDKLSKDKPIYLYCQVGFRGYLAYRTLIQSGFSQIFNLSGGFKTYQYATMKVEEFEPLKFSPQSKIIEQRLGRPVDDITGQKSLKIINACGISCPGPLNSMIKGLKELPNQQFLQISATDPSFTSTLKTYIELNNNIELISLKKENNILSATIFKNSDFCEDDMPPCDQPENKGFVKESLRPVGLPILSEISVNELYGELQSDNPPAIIIDVREKYEWKSGHLKEAKLISLGKFKAAIKSLESYKQKEIIIICHIGSRSYMAGRVLKDAGFEYIRSVRGGMSAWKRAKYNYEK